MAVILLLRIWQKNPGEIPVTRRYKPRFLPVETWAGPTQREELARMTSAKTEQEE